jgi:hypothetical protein
MLFDLLFDALVDWLASPVFDRLPERVTALIFMIGCVLCFVIWWVSGVVLWLAVSGLFGAAAVVAFVASRRR